MCNPKVPGSRPGRPTKSLFSRGPIRLIFHREQRFRENLKSCRGLSDRKKNRAH